MHPARRSTWPSSIQRGMYYLFKWDMVRHCYTASPPREGCTKGHGMSHEIAKLLLEHAETFLERKEAIKAAMALGMPLNEIQEYLDWLDSVRGRSPPVSREPPGNSGSPS